MATQAQIQANRQNAQRSTGPQTPQGKAIVAQNAVKHGLLAEKNIINAENQADFDLHKAQLLAELAPATPIESMLVDRVIDLSWRLRRSASFQNQAIDTLAAPDTSSTLSRLKQSILSNYDKTTDPETSLSQVIVKDFSRTRVLERMLMYERRIENSLYKTILEIQRLSMIKQINAEKESKQCS